MAKQTINGVDYYERESDAKEAYAVIPPAGEDSGVAILVHGVGEIGQGSLANLRNLVEGMDLDNNPATPGEYPLATIEWRKSLAKYNFTGVVVNYTKTGLTPSDFDYMRESVIRDYKCDPAKVGIFCFSLGGQQVIPEVAAKPGKYALAVLCAPVTPSVNWKAAVDTKLQIVGTSIAKDPRVPSSGIKGVISTINSLNPVIKPVYIEWSGEGHGSFNEMIAGTDSRIPQHPLDYINSLGGERKQYPTRVVADPSIPPSDPYIDFNIKDGQVITTSSFELDASASEGAKSFFWKVDRQSAPWIYPKLTGGTLGGPKKTVTNLVDGEYTAQLEINGLYKTPVRKFTVKLGVTTEPKKLVEASGLIVLKYSDGSTGTATVTVVDGKLQVTE